MSYRLSIGESITNRRDSTVTFSSTMSLAKLLQERGISAKVYHSPISENPLLQPLPKALAIPSTPPNSPSHSPCPSPLPFETRVHLSENFLASRPAETFLQEMYGLRPSRNPPDVGQLKMNLVDRLKRLGIARVVKTPDSQENGKSQEAEISLQKADSAVYLNSGSSLMGGLRRNQSLPVMMGSFGVPVCTSSPKMSILKEDWSSLLAEPLYRLAHEGLICTGTRNLVWLERKGMLQKVCECGEGSGDVETRLGWGPCGWSLVYWKYKWMSHEYLETEKKGLTYSFSWVFLS